MDVITTLELLIALMLLATTGIAVAILTGDVTPVDDDIQTERDDEYAAHAAAMRERIKARLLSTVGQTALKVAIQRAYHDA